MNDLEEEITSILKELEKNIKNDNKQQIEKNRQILDKLLNNFLEKFE